MGKLISTMAALVLALFSASAVLAQNVPETLIIGSSFSQTPWGFLDDNQQPSGIDVSICSALAKEMGAKEVKYVNLDFKGLIPALQADRFNMICAAVYITEEREKVVTMVPYIRSSQAILARAGSGLSGMDDLCGKSVSVLQGSAQLKVLAAQSEKCTAESKPEVKIQSFDTQPIAVRALENGNVEAFFASDQLVSYYLLKNPKLEKAAANINPVTLGIVVKKGNDALAKAISDGLVRMKENGSYDAVLKKWGIETAAIGSFDR